MLLKRETKRNKKNRLVIVSAVVLIAAALLHCFSGANAELATLDPEDWTLQTFLFDDSIDDGTTPLSSVDWTIESSERNETFERMVTLQINYRNELVDRTYEPGELEIRINNPFYNNSNYLLNIHTEISANKNGGSAYNWDLISQSYSETFVFRNSVPIEERTSIEGSIQIAYGLTSATESQAEQFLDSCTREISMTVQATMNTVVESNSVNVHYKRVYNHPWTREEYVLLEQAEKITSYEGLGENADDYTWVRYKYKARSTDETGIGKTYSNYAEHGLQNEIGIGDDYEVKTWFPSGLVIKNNVGGDISQDENGYIVVNSEDTLLLSGQVGSGTHSYCYSTDKSCWSIFVGYPKDAYNTTIGNTQITNEAAFYGTYDDRSEVELLGTSNVSLRLEDYEYTFSGNTLSVGKGFCGSTSSPYSCNSTYWPLYTQEIRHNGSTGRFTVNFSNKYGGQKYDLKIGDDVLYYVDDDNSIKQLEDDDYFFTKVTIPSLKTYNDVSIPNDKYSLALFVRKKGEASYSKYMDYDALGQTIEFTEDDAVVGWYFIIYDMVDSVKAATSYPNITIKSNSLPDNATFYNYAFGEVLVDGQPSYEITESDYAENTTRELVMAHDLSTYGHYVLHRATSARWAMNGSLDYDRKLRVTKGVNSRNASYNAAEEKFYGYFTLSPTLTEGSYEQVYTDREVNIQYMSDDQWTRSIEFYDLLPMGMDVDESTWTRNVSPGTQYCSVRNYMFDQNAADYFSSDQECLDYLNTHTSHTVTHNWHNTGRTFVHITIDFSERPFSVLKAGSSSASSFPSIILPYSVSYDAYREFGKTYTNRVYSEISNTTKPDGVLDNGSLDPDAVDINGNGLTDDTLATATTSVNLVSATATAQDLQTSVASNNSHYYDIGYVETNHDEDYEYKLRMRTGPSRVTNVVLYDSIEEAYGENAHWKGAFQGIDTSFAETQVDTNGDNIVIKTYWSANADAESLSTDSSWVEYDEATVDKSAVKALAFQYLDQNGNPAVLPQNSFSYVLVKMKSPADDSIHTFAYNNFRSEWNAIDNISGETVHDIMGIESNTVLVYMDEEFDLDVNIIWDDYDNMFDTRPITVFIDLYEDDVLVETREVNITVGENHIVFSDLKTVNQDKYRVVQRDITDYASTVERDEQSLSYTFTNRYRYTDAPLTGVDLDNKVYTGLFVFGVIGVAAVIGGICLHYRRNHR